MAESPRQSDFGRYRLIRPLGRGGMAEVHLAESQGPMSFRKLVAIKRLLPQYAHNKRYVQMLLDEAHIAGSINHPNVAQVIDLGQVEGVHYIAMEFIQGLDLASILQTLRVHGRALPVDVALHVSRCVGRGLHAAHTLVDADGQPLRVVHRDVSPHNVLISGEGEVKLIDFGVAKAETNLTMTRSGVIKGKLQYMSPEQARADAVDARADVFSLGMTLYKMLVGRLPFSGTNEFQIYDEILRKRVAPPSLHRPEIPEQVDAIVLKALRKQADERFQTADEMARVIDRALAAVAPGFATAALAEWLARELPSDQRFNSTDDDDFQPVDTTPPPEPAAPFDDDRIERLTRIEGGDVLVPTVRAVAAAEPAPTLMLTQVAARSPGPATVSTLSSEDPGGAAVSDLDAPLEPPEPTPDVEPAGHGRAYRALVLLVFALAGVLGVLMFQELNRPPVAAVPRGSVPPASPAATVASATTPADAPRPAPEAAPAGVSAATPIAPSERPSSPPAPASVGDAPTSTASFTAAMPAGPSSAPASRPAATPSEPPPRAYLTVSTLPWAWVHVDGQRLPRHTPVVNYALKPGRHGVRLITADGRTHEAEVNLRPGQRVTLSHAFP